MVNVSVVIPAFNAALYLPEAIESILGQTFRDFEVIVIDDCSTDTTWDVIQEYANRDSRICAYRNSVNLGIAGNRNKGVSLAIGKYLVWQDADDISAPERIEKQFHYMESHPRVGIVGGFLEVFNDRRGVTGVRKYFEKDVDLRKRIFMYSPVAQPAAMIRKSCLVEAGEYDLRLPPAEDLDMSFRIGCKHEFANLQEIVLKYREHPGSATFTQLRKAELSTLHIRKKNAKGHGGYRMSAADKVYNALHRISLYLVPPRLKIRIFNFVRNTRSIKR